MALERYRLQPDAVGLWSIVDQQTGLATHYRHCLMIAMGLDQAEAMAELLNENWRLRSAIGGVFVTVWDGRAHPRMQ